MARVISFLEDETMSQFQGKRFTHEYTHNVAPPEQFSRCYVQCARRIGCRDGGIV